MANIQGATYDGLAVAADSDGQFIIGGTYATAGDMTSASAGEGVTLTAAKPFALSVYADDGGTAVASSWVSAGFFSYENFAAQAAGSAIALTGQLHIGANFTACDYLSGVYGVVECATAKTVNSHIGAGQFALYLTAGTYGASYRLAAIAVSAEATGATINGTIAGIHFVNASDFGAAFSFGAVGSTSLTGTGADRDATVGDTALGHIIVYMGNTTGYINVYSDKS
jgi:hypothetical protein